MKKRLVITGASGFIAKRIADLNTEAYHVVKVSRQKANDESSFFFNCIDGNTDWKGLFTFSDTLIHTAASAHIAVKSNTDQLLSLFSVNVDGTLHLARQAAEAGVKRFIFLSSIGVNGVSNQAPFTVNDPPNPSEPYAQSKWEAEQGLMQIAEQTDMEVVIIRPPLVYGPNAPGNFGRLVRLVEKGIPLPLGAVHNQRTLVGLDNLVDLIRVCIDHPAAANQVILAGDDEDVSTTQILRGIAEGMGKPSRLIPVPESLLWAGASVLGKKAMAEKVLGSLQVDISETKRLLDWEPPYSFAEGMKRCFE